MFEYHPPMYFLYMLILFRKGGEWLIFPKGFSWKTVWIWIMRNESVANVNGKPRGWRGAEDKWFLCVNIIQQRDMMDNRAKDRRFWNVIKPGISSRAAAAAVSFSDRIILNETCTFYNLCSTLTEIAYLSVMFLGIVLKNWIFTIAHARVLLLLNAWFLIFLIIFISSSCDPISTQVE